MSKKINKRVPVGFSEEEYRVFRELIEQTMAKIVSEFVSNVIPVMKQMTANQKVVNNMPDVVREGFRHSGRNRKLYQNK
ncbi:hypothetical protein [Neisseria cinerea]|uniref:hypothetical protein n=1 Tax=Neisseria cinerea TaxID=483 RepID=UPI003C7A0D24